MIENYIEEIDPKNCLNYFADDLSFYICFGDMKLDQYEQECYFTYDYGDTKEPIQRVESYSPKLIKEDGKTH